MFMELSTKVERQRFTLLKIFAETRVNHKHLSNFDFGKRIFSRDTKRNNASSEALSFLAGIHADGGDFLPTETLFLKSSEPGKLKNLQTVLDVIWLVEVVFYYHSLLLSI